MKQYLSAPMQGRIHAAIRVQQLLDMVWCEREALTMSPHFDCSVEAALRRLLTDLATERVVGLDNFKTVADILDAVPLTLWKEPWRADVFVERLHSAMRAQLGHVKVERFLAETLAPDRFGPGCANISRMKISEGDRQPAETAITKAKSDLVAKTMVPA